MSTRYMVTVKYGLYPLDPECRGGGEVLYDGYDSQDAAYEATRAQEGKFPYQRVEIDRKVDGRWVPLTGGRRKRFLAVRERRWLKSAAQLISRTD
jgi:hypothetical protein